MKKKVVAVSGGFDPVHIGHVRMIQDAATHGDVVIIANSDEWLKRKKGYVFMSWEDRAEILESIKGVIKVVSVDDSDDTVCEALSRIKPDAFANGGDRKKGNTPEMDICKSLGIELLWSIGGKKIRSSSNIINEIK